MKKTILSLAVITALSGTLMANTTVGKNVKEETKSEKIAKKGIAEGQSKILKQKEEIVKKASEALILTKNVIKYIDKGKTDEATKEVEKAIGKLEVVLASDSVPKLLPVGAELKAYRFIGDINKIQTDIKATKVLLNEGKIQEARILLSTLRDELDLKTVSIPLATYPDALKLAAKYLHKGNTKEAKEVLITAMNTIVENTIIMPIPLLEVEYLVKESKEVLKTDKELALKHLSLAKKELKKAEVLGYLSKSEVTYKKLQTQIDELVKQIEGNKKSESFYEKLIDSIKSFKDKI